MRKLANASLAGLAGCHGDDLIGVGTTALDRRLDPLTLVNRHGGNRRCRVGVNSEARHAAREQSPRFAVALGARSW